MRLVAEDVSCVRGGRRLFQGLGFAVPAGQALLVSGPNGAGKTSLLRLIAGLLRPAAGRISLEGIEADGSVANAVHFVGHLDAVKGALTAAENLAFVRAMFGGGGETVEAALAALSLQWLADLPARMLSAGQRRRLALARLLVVPRPLWLLDEPTSALDAEGQAILTAIMDAHLAGGGILVAATHAPMRFARMNELRLGGGS